MNNGAVRMPELKIQINEFGNFGGREEKVEVMLDIGLKGMGLLTEIASTKTDKI